ncbi:MAG TPA: hypothetical protein VKN63_08700, partial [Afifellaceae bacterium]|nr:hypothetical protein [Afifellaceae bacterium]
FLAEIRAEAGVPIPVGDVVAVISESADGIATSPAAAENPESPVEDAAKATTEEPPTAALPAKAEKAAPEKRQAESQVPPAGRILASPKARLLASQRGIDLHQLVRQGVKQPFHAADLDRMSPASAGGVQASFSSLQALVEGAAFDALAGMAAQESDGPADSRTLWASFASGALRETFSSDGDIVVEAVSRRAGGTTLFRNADRHGLANPAQAERAGRPDLVIHDLCGTKLTNFRPGRFDGVPALSVGETPGGGYSLTFHFDEGSLPFDAAADFLTNLAGRVAEPLRNLL